MPDIAVVGLSCRFPGQVILTSTGSFLSEGRSATNGPEKALGYQKHLLRGLLSNVTDFDPKFFLISEAGCQRMLAGALT